MCIDAQERQDGVLCNQRQPLVDEADDVAAVVDVGLPLRHVDGATGVDDAGEEKREQQAQVPADEQS